MTTDNIETEQNEEKQKKKSVKNLKIEYHTKERIQQILKEAMEENDRYYMIFYTLANSGLRVSELVNLNPNNLNIENQTIIVLGKGKKYRSVDISSELTMMLYNYIQKNNIKRNKSIFPYDRSWIYKLSIRFTGKRTHLFRHTYAIFLLRKTKNIRYVQKQLGHKSLSTTEQYLQFMDFEEEKTQLGELLT